MNGKRLFRSQCPIFDAPGAVTITKLLMNYTYPGRGLTVRQLLRALRERVVSIVFVGSRLPASAKTTDILSAKTNPLI